MYIFLSCFIVSLFFCFNSYLCGKVIKKFNYKINDSIAFVLGSFVFFALLQLIIVPILLLQILNYSFLGYYFVGIQLALLIVYLFNGRFSLSILRINLIKGVYISFGILITFTILFAFKNYDYLKIPSESITGNTPLFSSIESNNIDKSLFNKFSNVVLLLLGVDNINLAKQYLGMFPFAVIVTNTIYGVFHNHRHQSIKTIFQNKNKYQIISFVTLIIFINILSLGLSTSPSDGNTGVIFSILLIGYLHQQSLIHKENVGFGLLLSFVSLGLFFISPNSVLCVVIINAYFLYANHKYRINNLLDFNLLMIFGTLLSISLFLNTYISSIGYIMSCLVIGLYLIYFFFRSTRIFRKEGRVYKIHKDIYYNILLYVSLVCIFALLTLIGFIQTNNPPNGNYGIINNVLNKTISTTQNVELYYVINVAGGISNLLVVMLSIYDELRLRESMFNKIQIINTVTIGNPATTQFWQRVLPNNINLIKNTTMIGSSYLVMGISKYLYNVNIKKNNIISLITLGSSITILASMTIINLLG